MKKLVALLCAAVMTVATCVTPFAAISGREPTAIDSTVVVDTANSDPAVAQAVSEKADQGIYVVAVPAVATDYADDSLAKAVCDVFASKDGTTAKVLAAAKVTDSKVKTPSNKEYETAKLAVNGQFLQLKFSDGSALPDAPIRVTLTISEAMKGKDLTAMQINTKKNAAEFQDLETTETTFTVDFPDSTGPFAPMEIKK